MDRVQVKLINLGHNQVVTKGIGQENCKNACASGAACHPGGEVAHLRLLFRDYSMILGLSSLIASILSSNPIPLLE